MRIGKAVNVRKVKRAVQGIVDQVLSNEQTVFNQGANIYEAGIAIFFRKSFNSEKFRARKTGSDND